MEFSATKCLLPYHLFIYREELKRRRFNALALTKTKIDITDQLITKCAANICSCNQEDIKAYSRQVQFKSKLEQQWRTKEETIEDIEMPEIDDFNFEFFDSKADIDFELEWS